ncbi:MAG TPA: molybdopterin-dependent oxidoreductase [Clostridia bacterium]|nr:molybdopterin-dependent oxidoreductase [Clostridia bacterium]
MKTVVHAACPHDCPDACGVLITVEDGRATRLQGDPNHPVTRGFLCAKVAKYIDRVYSPQRVLYPMKRVAPKGTGGFEAFAYITWDEALDTIAAKFRSVAAEFGSEAILPYSYGGTLGTIQGSTLDHRFFHRLGASQLDRTICASAGAEALVSVTGGKYGTEPEQFAHSRYIIAWGANIHGNNVHLWPFIEEARRKGAKLVVIDPYRTRTAKCADWYLPINPGTDVALALGMMHVIIGEALHDAAYVAQHTLGFDQLKAKVAGYTPERVAQWTGIPAEDIVRLAREYATARPAVIRLNYGIQRSTNGGMAVRAVSMLPCITGSWKEVGGGLQLSTSGAFPLDKQALKRTDLMKTALGRDARMLNMSELGRLLNEVNDPPVKAMFVFNSNPAAVCPDHNDVIRGLLRPDLFTAVHEQFLTDTTDYADMVLPATTFFEHKDLQTAYGHYYVQISNAAIAPVGEARSNADVFRALAERMGFAEPCFAETDEEIMDQALASGHEFLAGITRERLQREGHVRLNVPGNDSGWYLPFANGFPTASGKAELYSEKLAAQGLDPVAEFVPPAESRHTAAASEFPLELLARKADNYLNSTFCNLPSHQKMEETELLEMNEADASARGIRDGDRVRVFNRRGELRLTARIDGAVQRGVVGARLNWAKLSPENKNINVLTSQRLTDMAGGATFYSVLVEVERA